MTAIAKTADWISPEEYLEEEKWAPIRREYVDGRVYVRPDVTVDHNRITGNLACELKFRLRDETSEVFICSFKVRIPEPTNVYYYPDVLITGNDSEIAEYYCERPSYVFEVISPETERTDRREKALAYRAIPGIKGYVILEQDQIEATVMRPSASGWTTEALRGPNAVLVLPDLKIEIPLARIYERTSLFGETS